jgi:hypothetical protein
MPGKWEYPWYAAWDLAFHCIPLAMVDPEFAMSQLGVFDRSAVLPGGGRLEQADGTAWMAMFSQSMLELALMLLDHDETYQGFVLKFVEHFFWIAAAVDPLGENPDEMWDEEDGFFYDVLRLPDGTVLRVLPRRQRGRARRQPPDRLDRAGGPHHHAAARHGPGRPARRRAGRGVPAPVERGGEVVTGWPEQPVIHEVDTWPWLADLGPDRTLGTVPAQAWDALAVPGVDAVWLMGVWERSPAGLAIALGDAQLSAACARALPDLAADDVVGSPYCIRRYVVDARLGGPAGLATARAELARRGVRLLLDYVPNHVAPDHPWVHERPEVFVRGSADDLSGQPDAFVEVDGQVLARGRDPYFPPWPDVVQLDAFSPAMRGATVETLSAIGDQCDGVRCDMAMLMLTEVFSKTWGAPPPPTEFWPEVLGRVREQHQGMLFLAEAYWDLEWALQQQGFDHCYDKRLVDRLVGEDAAAVRAHLEADVGYQRRLVRFLENHDEPRAAAELAPVERERAAAVVIATLPGATLWHEGQFDGRRAQLPVFLGRRPGEPLDAELRRFHLDLIAAVASSGMRTGQWQALDCTGWPDNPSYRQIVAWCWRAGDRRHLVVVNLAAEPAQARVPVPWPELAGRSWQLRPVLGGEEFERAGDEVLDPGLFVSLEPWGWHVLTVSAAG